MATVPALINNFIQALVASERWQAARQLKHGFMTERWLVILIVISVTVTVAGLAAFNYKRKQQRKSAAGLTIKYAAKKEVAQQKHQLQEIQK